MNILVYDHGLCLEAAIKLAEDGHKVAYYTPWQKDFPEHGTIIGSGFPGVTRVDNFTRALEDCQMLACFDTYSQEREELGVAAGKLVWGARKSEQIELDRIYTKKLQERLRLPTQPWQVIKGIDKLIPFLLDPKNEKKWVKTTGLHRGLIETFYHDTWENTRSQEGGQLMVDFGPIAEDIDFLIEDPVGDCEPGWDGFFAGGEHLQCSMVGYECKDESYIGKIETERTEPFRLILGALTPRLANNETSSLVSYEVRIDKARKSYLIDPCLRAPHPPFAVELEIFENFSNVVIEGAKGNGVHVRNSSLYGAAIEIKSSWVDSHWCRLEFEPKYRHLVKLQKACFKRDGYWALPGSFVVGTCVGLGETPKEAASMAKKVASTFKCKGMYYDEASLDNLVSKTIPEGKKYGVDF